MITTRGPDKEPMLGAPALKGTADVGAQRIARVYAESLYRAAEKTGQVQEVLEEVDSLINDVLAKSHELAILITGSAIGRHAKEKVIRKAFEGRATPLLVNFLLVLNDHDRLALLPTILSAMQQLDNERKRRIPVQVWTAVPLPDDQRDVLTARLRTDLGGEPILNLRVDPDLLGGLVVRAGDYVYDSSVRTQLARLREQLITRSSHEIQSRRDRFCTDS
jgi:F-type H+-transporting ATPase subunit delta